MVVKSGTYVRFNVNMLGGFSFALQRKRSDSDPEYADCGMSETVKEEATFEDKMVDTMVLEDPQNMYQALEK